MKVVRCPAICTELDLEDKGDVASRGLSFCVGLGSPKYLNSPSIEKGQWFMLAEYIWQQGS